MSKRHSPIQWTPALDAWLRDTFADNQSADLAALVGCSTKALRMRATKLGLHKSRAWRAQNARETTAARSVWKPALLEILRLMYPVQRTQDLAELFGIKTSRLHAKAGKLGLHKTKDLVRQMARERMTPEHPGRRHQFPKGHVPANKGIKGISHPASIPTQFKKGQRPYTWKPLGTERTNADGYRQRKMTDTGYPPRDWVFIHRLNWEAPYGPIPAGHVLCFKDGNRQNVALANLELITCAERMRRNSFHTTMPPELRTLVHTRAILTRVINRRTRATQEQAPS